MSWWHGLNDLDDWIMFIMAIGALVALIGGLLIRRLVHAPQGEFLEPGTYHVVTRSIERTGENASLVKFTITKRE